MKAGFTTRTAVAGALAAAALGSAAGSFLRPELGPPDTGPALIVSVRPEFTDTVSYADSWWAVHRDDAPY